MSPKTASLAAGLKSQEALCEGVALSRFPCRYGAMMAICSDLDVTPDSRMYWEISRFLNTTETTPPGPGVGLEVRNSIYFDMAPTEFAHRNTNTPTDETER